MDVVYLATSLKYSNPSQQKCQKKKDVVRLRLLLSYLQNGIDQPWQKIPSIIAVFVAEASLVLLDPSHENYSTISKYLRNSPSVNMKVQCSRISIFLSVVLMDK